MTISHSFTIDEAKKSKEHQLLVESFDINSDPSYKLDKAKEQFNKDANRSAMLLLETPDGKVVDLIEATLKEQNLTKKDAKLNYYDLVSSKLQNDYKLSDKQAEYILSSSHQGGIGGSTTGFGGGVTSMVANSKDPNIALKVNFNQVIAPKITINQDDTLSFSASSKNIFDVDKSTSLGEAIKNHVAYNDYSSNDYMYAQITTNLGKINQPKEILVPKTTIDLAGEGANAAQVIKTYKDNIPSDVPLKDLTTLKNAKDTINENVVKISDASTLEKSTYKGANKQYQEQLHENIKNVLSDTNNPKSLNVETLKRFPQTKTELAGILVDKVDKQLNNLKDNKQPIKQAQLTKIGEDLAKDLSKFTDNKSQGAVKLFSKELVSQRASEQGMKLPKQNFISKIVTKLKEMWHGVSIDKQKNITQNVKEMINNFSQKHNSSTKTPTHVINHKENNKNSNTPHH